MARASTYTMLSLDNYARIMGLNPIHFAGGYGSPMWPEEGCNDVWPQHPWQSLDLVSREELARAIYGAEEEVARVVGYYPAPRWTREEAHSVSIPYRGSRYFVRDVGTIALNFRMVAQAGAVALRSLGTFPVTYDDVDDDGWEDTATIVATGQATGLDMNGIRAAFVGKGGMQEWHIRPLRSVTQAGSTVTVTLDSWLLTDPALWEKIPTTDGFRAIDMSTSDNFVSEVELWIEEIDEGIGGIQIHYDHYVTGYDVLDGSFHIVDPVAGIVKPYRAACYPWLVEDCTACNGPIRYVKFNYRSGLFPDERTLDGRRIEMEGWMAEAIAWIATARLFKPICTCNNIKEYVDFLRADTAKSSNREFRNMSPAALTNPFGTRQGEVMAWNRLVNAMGGLALSAMAL